MIDRNNGYEEQESAGLYLNVLRSVGCAILLTDIRGVILLINPIAEELTGYTSYEAVGLPLSKVFNLFDEKTQKPYLYSIESILQHDQCVCFHDDLLLRNKERSNEYYIAGSSCPVADADGKTMGVVISIQNITEQKIKEEEMRRHSFYDSLTGLYNRAFFEEELKRMDSERMLPLTLIMGDANGLKLVNDAFGHQAGDKMMVQIASILKDVCRREDVIARVGGDEFVIILPGVGSEEACQVLERIRQRCEVYSAHPVKLSIALGTATKKYKDQNIQIVYRQAEERMYTTKLNENKTIRNQIIHSIQSALETHTHETVDHGHRLKALLKLMAKHMNLFEYEFNHLELLSALHDIGKIAIPENILEKQGELLTEEWKHIKKHCEIGYRIAVYSPELVSIADAILSHHERWDGTGYPQGLKGEHIPLYARILAIADAYDTMTHDRPYHLSITHELALDEIMQCAGSQFDPALVEVFIEVMRKKEEVD